MGKSKKGVSHAGPHKKHGPKRHLFKEYKPMIKAFADAGVLDKYHNLESFILACQSKGLKHGSKEEWENRFKIFTTELKSKEEQKIWLNNCKNYREPEKDKKSKKAQ